MSGQTVLLVDDEPDILQLLEITLARMNLSTRRATNLAEARAALEECTPDLCLTDMKLPDGNGLTLIEHMQNRCPEVPVAMITAHGSVESAIEALKLGAFDFVTKPLALEKLRELVGHALQIRRDTVDVAAQELIGTSPVTEALREQVRKVARSQAPVHIQGESGVGKEVVARLIHRLGPRAGQPFIAVNCGAIPPDLVESELFGHKKGAFTGATSDKPGLFMAASGGTLLLDEVADLPLPVQVKLLRAIQEKSVRPVGSESEVATDVRLLSATHKNLAFEARAGRFRDDLYYRINVIGIHVPALRERLGDVPELADHLLQKMATEHRSPRKHLSDAAEFALQQHSFPGNIRELENILARASALTEGEIIEPADLAFQPLLDDELRAGSQEFQAGSQASPHALSTAASSNVGHSHLHAGQQIGQAGAHREAAVAANSENPVADANKPISEDSARLLAEVNGDLETYLADIERGILNEAMVQHRWNKTATAKHLGISFRSLRYRLKKLGLED